MKKLYITLLVLLTAAVAAAQNPTTYFMEGSTMRSQWNPAFAPMRGYVNVPVLGGIQIGVEGNLALDNIFYPNNGSLTWLLDGAIPTTVALDELDPQNSLGTGIQLNILGFGAYTKNRKNFWSFDVSMRVNVDTRLPYELFEFLKTGNSTHIADLGLSMESYAEAAFSYSFPVTKKLYLGVRGKFLVGAARLNMNFDRFDASLGADRWYANAMGTMTVSGMVPATTVSADGTPIYDLDEIADEVKIPAGYGFGIDVGATYDLLPNLQLSASLNDFGFMYWSKKHTAVGRVENTIEFTGVEIDDMGNASQPTFDLDELEFAVQENDGKARMLRASLNVGGEYEFLNRRIGVGLFYNIRFWEYKTRHNLTLSGNFRPLRWLHVSGSYSFVNNSGSAVGLGLNLCPGWINFFVATDILLSKKTPQWLPTSQSNMNITFGLGYPLGKRSLREAHQATQW